MPRRGGPGEAELGGAERALLLGLARRSVEARVRTGAPLAPPADPAWLLAPQGAFVTLHVGGRLRGCVGYPLPTAPLGRTVVECAASAAAEDRRFAPVGTAELAALRVEVSLLSLPRPGRPEEVVPGRHGVLVRHEGRRGLLLPQVATEHGWERETLLAHACLKAGLPAAAWRVAELELFEAEVFGD